MFLFWGIGSSLIIQCGAMTSCNYQDFTFWGGVEGLGGGSLGVKKNKVSKNLGGGE